MSGRPGARSRPRGIVTGVNLATGRSGKSRGARPAPVTAPSAGAGSSGDGPRRSQRAADEASHGQPAIFAAVRRHFEGLLLPPGSSWGFKLGTAEGRGFCWGSSLLLGFCSAVFPKYVDAEYPGDDSVKAPASGARERKVEALCRDAVAGQWARVKNFTELSDLRHFFDIDRPEMNDFHGDIALVRTVCTPCTHHHARACAHCAVHGG